MNFTGLVSSGPNLSHSAFEITQRDPDPGRAWKLFWLQKGNKNAQMHLIERGRWNRSFQMDAALLETGKKSQEVETRENQSGKQKTCKRLIIASINNTCSGLGQQEQQWEKPPLGRGEGRQELLSRRTELQGLFTPPLSMREEHRALPMEMNLGSGVRQSCESGGSTHSQFPCPNEPHNRSVFCHLSP